jgi:hypothetical protein
MNVGVMKDYKLKLGNLRASHTLVCFFIHSDRMYTYSTAADIRKIQLLKC